MALVTVTPYQGALLAPHLLSSAQTIILGNFGTPLTNQLITETQLPLGEPVDVGGTDYVTIGSGTAQPGISILGVTLPTGFPVDLVVVQDGAGDVFFLYPDGEPFATGMIALIVDIDEIGYNLLTNGPLCLAQGTMVLTCAGRVPVEHIAPGMHIATSQYGFLPVLWRKQEILPRHGLAMTLPPGSVPGMTHHLTTTLQHRVVLLTDLPGFERALVAARHFSQRDIAAIHRHVGSKGHAAPAATAHTVLFVPTATSRQLYGQWGRSGKPAAGPDGATAFSQTCPKGPRRDATGSANFKTGHRAQRITPGANTKRAPLGRVKCLIQQSLVAAQTAKILVLIGSAFALLPSRR
ncbi:hypothetical protein BFP70_06405 [Thioclava sp. SK-1]|uniref:Hint domain-containing protein n=1 Tax=Thioclava sp. SK-1 TaxID=1889770 RepID=UPI00082449A0|nr:Hint domain-containing protein [Thioclava sp. SK-1]OCX65773.1 hypothetical protein BFP70_06405 [Thioclava sp. SK-1]